MVRETKRGYEVLLDQTAFYPTSGGQPCDTGNINGIPVLDVWDDDQGNVRHLLDSSPGKGEIVGEIDWLRRFDHMQQHTGQHILSAAFVEELDANTMGFQLGSATSTIDLDIPSLTHNHIRNVEKMANRIVWENHPLKIHYVTENDVENIPFRKPPQVKGQIRVVWIADIDASACGGTHVSATGEIGIIKVTGFERYKGNIRVSFICGNRAFKDYQNLHDNVQQISKELSIHKDELPIAVTRIQKESSSYQNALKNVQKEIMEMEADQLWKNTKPTNGIRHIHAFLKNRAYDELMIAVNRLRNYPNTVILLSVSDGEKIRVICSRSNDQIDYDAGKLIKSALKLLNGQGGGNPEIAFGGAPMSNPEVIVGAFQDAIKSYEDDKIS